MQPTQDDELAQRFNTEGGETIGDKLAESNGIADKDEVQKKKISWFTESKVKQAYTFFQICPK